MIETIVQGAVTELHFNHPPANAMGVNFLRSLREAIASLADTRTRAVFREGG